MGLILRASFCHGAEDLFARREPVDIVKAAGTSRLLLVGDDHTHPAIKHFLAAELARLHRAGFSHLAVEMVTSDLQGGLDAWTPESRERIRRHLETAWAEKGPGVPESIFALINAAKERGMEVLALDPPDVPSRNRLTVNPFWADRIKSSLSKSPSVRMVVFAGRSHVDHTPASLTSLLDAHGVSVSVVDFSGLDSEETTQMDLKTARLLGRSAHPTTVLTYEGYRTDLKQSCMVSCPMKSCCKYASNWIIHLPEVPSLFLAQR